MADWYPGPERPGLSWLVEVELGDLLAGADTSWPGDLTGDGEGGRDLEDPEALAAMIAERDQARAAGRPRDLAGVLAEQLPAGPGLAACLAGSDLAGVSDWDLPGIAAGWHRLASWAQARELAAVTAITARAAARDERVGVDADGLPRQVTPGAAAEVSLALTMSQCGATWWAGLGIQLAGRLAATGAALEAGIIDVPRARIIAEALAPLDAETARAAEARVLPKAREQTTGQLRAAVRRAVITVDPKGADERRRNAERHADVKLYPDEQGTAALIASNLPGVHAAAAHARIIKAAGAGGGIRLLRAQVLIGLLLGTLPLIPPPPGAPPDDPLPDHDPGGGPGGGPGGSGGSPGGGSPGGGSLGNGLGDQPNADLRPVPGRAGAGPDNGAGGNTGRASPDGRPADNTPDGRPAEAGPPGGSPDCGDPPEHSPDAGGGPRPTGDHDPPRRGLAAGRRPRLRVAEHSATGRCGRTTPRRARRRPAISPVRREPL